MVSDQMLLVPSGLFTPEDDGLFAQPHEDFLEMYRNAALVTSLLPLSPIAKAIAAGVSGTVGFFLFVDDVLDGSHVNNIKKVTDLLDSVVSDDPDHNFNADIVDNEAFSATTEFIHFGISVGTNPSKHVQGGRPRCTSTDSRGRQCRLEAGHTGRHSYV